MQLQPESPWLREGCWHGDLSRGEAADRESPARDAGEPSPEKAVASAKLIKSTATDLEIKCGRRERRRREGRGARGPNRGATALPFWCDSRYVWQTDSFRERRWGGGKKINCFSYVLIVFNESLW